MKVSKIIYNRNTGEYEKNPYYHVSFKKKGKKMNQNNKASVPNSRNY